MTQVRTLARLLALAGVVALPACSMFGGDDSSRTSRTTSAGPSYAAAAPAPVPAVAPPLTPEMIRSVQQTLQQNGLYRGHVDGVWGPRTQSAVRGYQQQHNLTASGQLDQATLSAMNLGTSPDTAQQAPDSQRYGSNYNPPLTTSPDGTMPQTGTGGSVTR
ncbi:MAG: peptidoglycan-binding domain-containing protein [Acetobacteraceae bacterium]